MKGHRDKIHAWRRVREQVFLNEAGQRANLFDRLPVQGVMLSRWHTITSSGHPHELCTVKVEGRLGTYYHGFWDACF